MKTISAIKDFDKANSVHFQYINFSVKPIELKVWSLKT